MAGGTRGQLLPIGWNIALADDPPKSLTQGIVHIVLRLRSGEMQLTAADSNVWWLKSMHTTALSFPLNGATDIGCAVAGRPRWCTGNGQSLHHRMCCSMCTHSNRGSGSFVRKSHIEIVISIHMNKHFMSCLDPAQPHGAPVLYNRQPGIDAFDQLARERSEMIGVYVGQRKKAIDVLNGIQMLEKVRKSTPSKNAEAGILGRELSMTVVHVAQAGFGRLKDLSTISTFA